MLKALVLLASTSFAATPEWAVNVPFGYRNDYKLCISNDSKREDAEAKATEACIREVLVENKFFVESNEVILERKNEKLSLSTKLKYKTSQETIENLRVSERYSEIENGEYKSYILVAYPKKNPQAIPYPDMVSVKELMFPGWGSASIGQQNLANSRYFNSMALILATTISYYIMADAYHDARVAKLPSDSRIYREKADFYRNWTVGLGLSYAIYATYCSIDIKSSKYLLKYL
jgi:hypothetical protein